VTAVSAFSSDVQVDFFSSTFCEPCMVTRRVLSEAERLVSSANVVEHDIVRNETEAERLGIRMAPTVIVSDSTGAEVFRAEGIPSLNQVLVALAKAV
jgi:predicted DsbA family dithiol-disulfide isomerase